MANPPPKIYWAVFVLVALLALVVRLPQLGARPMHTDESVNAYITGKLLAGDAFHYDPRDRHGPGLFVFAEPLAKLLGAKNFAALTESELRLTPVIAGCCTILLLGAGVGMFGFIPCLIAALLLAIGPLPVYYDRYFIHESLFVLATLGLILSGWRMLKTGELTAAAVAGLCAAFMIACKETAVIHWFALAVAIVICRKAFNFSLVQLLKLKRSITVAAGVFIFLTILLFTWFGQNWSVFSDLIQAIPNFTARAGGEGHAKPFWYYAWLLDQGWSGLIFLTLTLIGIVRTFRRTTDQAGFGLAIYALTILVIYSAIPYKTPWLALNFWLPLAIFAGMAIEWFWFLTSKLWVRTGIIFFLMTFGFLLIHDTRQWAFLKPADEKNPYAYAHTGEDLLRLPGRLEQIEQQKNLPVPRIAVVAADAWPLPWYLRKFPDVGFWQPGQNPGPADLFITSTEVSNELAARLKHFRPEFFGWRPNVLLILWVPEAQAK